MAAVAAATSRNHLVASEPILDSSYFSDAHLFVKNLHFLDLDLLPDWPAITAATFRITKDAHSGQKHRIQSAEWALYRLFEIWDPKETKLKLRPYFPALEPIQSIKLRAALLQWLTQLKSAAILGRECALRKSLFDECKGDKFEEILLCFSTIVLQKVVVEANKPASLVQNLAIAKAHSTQDEEKTQILQLAHQSAIGSQLAQRKTYRNRVHALADTIRNRTESLESRASLLEAEVQRHESALNAAGVDAHSMKKQLRSECTGDAAWLSLVLSGDSDQGRDGLIERQFADIWTQATQGDELTLEQCPKSLLSELDDRVNAQKQRLDEWRNFQMQVSKRNETFIVAKSPTKTPLKSPNKAKTITPMRTTHGRGNNSNTASAVKRGRPVKPGVQSSLSYARGGLGPTSPKTPEPLLVSDEQTPNAMMERSNVVSKSHESDSPAAKRRHRSQSPLKSALPIRQHHRSRSDLPSPSSPSAHGRLHFHNDEPVRHDRLGSNNLDSDASLALPAANPSQTTTPSSTENMAGPSVSHNSPNTQTLSERTLQTLQQCQISNSSTSQRHPQQTHIQSRSESVQHRFSKPSLMGTDILGPHSPPTPESSRPGTAKSVTTALHTPTAAGLNEADFRFPASSPAGGSKPPPSSSSAQSHARFTSPSKRLGDSPVRQHTPQSPVKSGDCASPKIPENEGRAGAQTPPELLFAEDADCTSVFKSRSKLRHSRPGSPVDSTKWN